MNWWKIKKQVGQGEGRDMIACDLMEDMTSHGVEFAKGIWVVKLKELSRRFYGLVFHLKCRVNWKYMNIY